MNYNYFTLFLFGVLGLLAHNFIKMDELNKKQGGKLSIIEYLKIERFAIMVNLIIIFAAVMGSQEIKKVKDVGEYLGLAFIAIGYMGQSIIVKYMGKAEAIVKQQTGQ